jgi:hypothetical protein
MQRLSATNVGTVAMSTGWSIAGTGDFNGDGYSDILWSNTNGDASIWLMTPTPTTPPQMQSSPQDLGSVSNGWSIVGTGDFNSDGFSDILRRNINGDLAIWFMTGNGTQVQQLGQPSNLGVVPTSWSVQMLGAE